jgi:hypothetical protein
MFTVVTCTPRERSDEICRATIAMLGSLLEGSPLVNTTTLLMRKQGLGAAQIGDGLRFNLGAKQHGRRRQLRFVLLF